MAAGCEVVPGPPEPAQLDTTDAQKPAFPGSVGGKSVSGEGLARAVLSVPGVPSSRSVSCAEEAKKALHSRWERRPRVAAVIQAA